MVLTAPGPASWVRGLGSHTRPHVQKGPMLGLMFCSYCLKILGCHWTRAPSPHFHFSMDPTQCVAGFAQYLYKRYTQKEQGVGLFLPMTLVTVAEMLLVIITYEASLSDEKMESQRFHLESKWSQVSQLIGGSTIASHNSRAHQPHYLKSCRSHQRPYLLWE